MSVIGLVLVLCAVATVALMVVKRLAAEVGAILLVILVVLMFGAFGVKL